MASPLGAIGELFVRAATTAGRSLDDGRRFDHQWSRAAVSAAAASFVIIASSQQLVGPGVLLRTAPTTSSVATKGVLNATDKFTKPSAAVAGDGGSIATITTAVAVAAQQAAAMASAAIQAIVGGVGVFVAVAIAEGGSSVEQDRCFTVTRGRRRHTVRGRPIGCVVVRRFYSSSSTSSSSGRLHLTIPPGPSPGPAAVPAAAAVGWR